MNYEKQISAIRKSIQLSKDFLLSNKHDDGGWGYTFRNKLSFMEPSSWSLRALSFSGTTISEDTMLYFVNRQNSDGGWGNLTASSSDSMTSRVAWALCAVDIDQNIKNSAIDWLIKNQFPNGTWGWKIESGTGFIEPLTYSLLALNEFHYPIDQQLILRSIISLRCDDGGWNCHTPEMSGIKQQSQDSTNALGIISVLTIEENYKDILKNIVNKYEKKILNKELSTPYSLGLFLWAFTEIDDLIEDITINNTCDLLLSQQQQDGSWGNNIFWTAIDLYAMSLTLRRLLE